MAAIITDQIRILNAKNFVAGVSTSTNSYYSFVGLTDPAAIQSDWDDDPPSPIDNFTNHNDFWDTAIALKKINATDVKQVTGFSIGGVSPIGHLNKLNVLIDLLLY